MREWNFVRGRVDIPFRVDVTKALKEGENIRIDVVNTWNNRLVSDSHLPQEKITVLCTHSNRTPNQYTSRID
jgi:hypothetical protein